MVKYIPYDPLNPVAIIGEQHTIVDGKIRLRHTPVEHSIKISNFTEVASPAALHLNEFACMYSRETAYRESNRIVYFSTAHNGATVLVNYSGTGTVVTADDMNEIKAHLDSAAESELMNEVAHNKFSNDILALQKAVATISSTYQLPTASDKTKGGVRIGSGLSMAGEVLYSLAENYTLPTASDTVKGGVKIGDGLEMSGDTLNCTVEGDSFFHYPEGIVGHNLPIENDMDGTAETWSLTESVENSFRLVFGRESQFGDIINWTNTGHGIGHAYRAAGKWFNLDADFMNGSERWCDINPLLTHADRVKLDGLENYSLPTATATKLGGVKVGDGLEIVDGKLNVTISGADYSIASQSAINDMLNNIFGG